MLCVEKGTWIAQQGTIRFVFKVKVQRLRTVSVGNRPGQCRLADLARSQQDHAGHLRQAIADELFEATGDHSENIGIPHPIVKYIDNVQYVLLIY